MALPTALLIQTARHQLQTRRAYLIRTLPAFGLCIGTHGTSDVAERPWR
jgi:hypothetical protein